VIGLVIFGVGLGITLATYNAAEPGDSYVVMRGAILFGGVQALFGLWRIIQGASRGY